MKQAGFFDVEERLARLSGLGDQLEAFSQTVDFEVFRPDLEQALAYSDGSKGGRPPFDPVLMFKILVIQTLNNLSDERTEYLINDRLSFMRFLGLGLSDRVPDAKTVWLFRERLTLAGAIDGLFNRFDITLRSAGYLPMSGQILDATLVAAPKQRNTNAEKVDLREGRNPEDWQNKPAKLSHKDRHARWTLKFTKAKRQDDGSMPAMDLAIPFFGYKSHISIDRKFRFIRKGRRRMPPPVMVPDCVKAYWIKPIRPQAFGPTRPIARKPTRPSWTKRVSSRKFTGKSRISSPCPAISSGPTRENR